VTWKPRGSYEARLIKCDASREPAANGNRLDCWSNFDPRETLRMDRPKLKRGMKAFACKEREKYFHKGSALISFPIYPQHAEAFRTAVELAIDAHQSAKRGPNRDTLIFPVLYLYRHCLELRLKDLVFLGIRTDLFSQYEVKRMLDKDNGILGKHALCPLWTQAKRVILHNYPNDTEAQAAEAMINEFDRIDRDGQTLRYDKNKGTLKLRKYETLPSHIGITTLRTNMERLLDYLGFCYDGILDWWDAGQSAMPSGE
jgi:hypothetical protein